MNAETLNRLARDKDRVTEWVQHAIDRAREGRIADANENLDVVTRIVDGMRKTIRESGECRMSSATKRPLAEARIHAEAFREMFAGAFEQWHITGSIRRGRPSIGDCEHVVVPKFAAVNRPGEMFQSEPTNLVWHRLNELLVDNVVAKAVYGGATRWGELYRGVHWRDMKHEIFTADAENLGSILCIRTGPAEFSRAMVTKLKNGGTYRQQGGYLMHQRGEAAGTRSPCPDERDFFRACGCRWLEPHERDGAAP